MGSDWSAGLYGTGLQQAKVMFKYAICTPYTVDPGRIERASACDWLAPNAFATYALPPSFFQRLHHNLARQL